jgi:hypothetical protein
MPPHEIPFGSARGKLSLRRKLLVNSKNVQGGFARGRVTCYGAAPLWDAKGGFLKYVLMRFGKTRKS